MPRHHHTSAFTLIELLVVISIIALLVGILLPALAGSRATARTVKCASNLHQLGIAFSAYAADSKGKYPQNDPGSSTTLWYQTNVLGYYMPGAADKVTTSGAIGGLALPCPSDISNAARSYTMNGWGSSYTNAAWNWIYPASRGKRWDSSVRDGSKVMLGMEAWTIYSANNSYYARAYLGFYGLTPYQKLVNDPETAGRLTGTPAESRLDYSRHTNAAREPLKAQGIMNILFVDAHVAAKSDNDLVDRTTLKSRYQAMWTPDDAKYDN